MRIKSKLLRKPNDRRKPKPWYYRAWHSIASIISIMVILKAGVDVINYSHKFYVERQQEQAKEREDKARDLIHKLFDCWRTGDLDGYMSVWAPDAKQISDVYVRNVEQIREKRKSDFEKYKHIWTKELFINIPEPNPEKVDVYVTYTMRFVPDDSSQPAFNEENISERYILVWDSAADDWKIKINLTYLHGFPENTPIMMKQK